MNSENYQLMEAFEQAWQRAGEEGSSPPAWQEFAPRAGSDDLLLYVLEMDIEQRARRGLPGIIEQRYWEHPALTNRLADDQKIGLIKTELLHKKKSNLGQASLEQVDAATYATAFPALARHPLWQSLPWDDVNGLDDAAGATHNGKGKAKIPQSAGTASQLIGPYKLLQKLGQGGMGEVWMAEQREPVKRRVALKLVKTGLDNKQVIARFEAERQALSMMDHPNIARVLDAGTTAEGQPYFVMELVLGVPFNSYCDQHKLSIDQRLRLFIPVCQAVQHAHQKGIIHRDLKPSNVLVSLYDGEPVAKVIDFGLAKALQPSLQLTDKTMFTEFGQVVGTLQYMSPEQAELNQLDVDTRTDIYSLGVMLYELLTGSTPLDQDTMQRQAILQVLEVIRTQEPPRPSARLSSSTQEAVSGISEQRQIDPGKLRSILPGALDWIVMRALEKDRTRRYETASGFAEDIARYLEGEPVLARPPSAGYRLRKYVRRNKGLVASLASIALLLVGGIIGTSWFAYKANRAKAESDRNANAAELARKESVRREQEAIDAVRRFGDSVAKNADLKNRPELESLRRTLLKEPLAYIKSLAEQLQQGADNRPESMSRLAQVAFDLAVLTNEIGNKQDALTASQRALEIQERLVRDNPTVTEYQNDLARSHNNIGALLSGTGEPNEALSAHQRALEIRERLVRDNPTVTEYQGDLARSHYNIGTLLSKIGQPREAMASYQRALEIEARLVRDNPSVTEYQGDLARSHNNIGALLRETGEPREAMASYQRALEIRERLVRDNPTVTEYQSGLANSNNNIGALLRETGEPREALVAYQRALEIRERLVRDNPTVTEYQSDLAGSHNNIGLLLEGTGKPAEALAAFQHALEIQERLVRDNPTVTADQSDLAGSHSNIGTLLRQTGQPNEALAAYQRALEIQERLVRDNPTVTNYQNGLANSHIYIGALLCETGEPREAMSSYQRALEILERLVRDNPTVTNYQNGLAGSHYNIGLLLSETGELNEALAAYQRALEIRERLVRDNPTVTEYQWGLADSHYSIGNLLCKTGEPNEALASYQRALEIQERLVRDNPTVTEYQSGLASSHNNIGNLLSDTGELKEALAAYQRALEIQERLARDNPTVTEYQSAVGATLNNMATLDLENQRFGEARQKLVKAIEFQQRALVGNPNQPVYRQFLGNHYINLAAAAEGLKDGALLLQARRGMAELARDPDGELNEQFAEALNSLIWELVKQPPDAVSLEFLTEELPQLRSVVNQFPSGVYYNTLGTAEYRMGNHQAAIDACAKSLEQLPKELNLSGPHPGDLAILAMSHRQLGNAEEANKFREQFKEAMKKESFKDDPECQGFAAEVTELFSKHEQPKTPTSEASKSTSDK